MENKNLPKKTYRAGNISLSLWENDNNKSYSFQKVYKEENSNQWKQTQVLNLNDLPKLKMLVEEAYKEDLLKWNSAR